MSKPHIKVLISGAGITGPCLAYWLTKTPLSIDVTIVERSTVPRTTGQAIDIRGTAIEIVKKMGMIDAVKDFNTTEVGTAFINPSGKIFAQFEAGDTFTAEYEILRADLSQLFLDATEKLGNVKYVYGDYIESLQQNDKEVSVTFNSGKTETFDLLVAADGYTSKTRGMFLDESITKDCYNFLGQYTAFFSVPSVPTDQKLWQWYNALGGLGIMLRPHRNPETMGAYLCITTQAKNKKDDVVEAALDKGTEETKKMLHEYFDNTGWEAKRVLEGMDKADDFYMTRMTLVRMPKWTNNRCLVLGDAAWATFGIGTSLAIEGPYILAGELGKIKDASELPAALERYESVFRPIFKKMDDPPPGFPQLAFPHSGWGLKIRDSLLWLASRTKIYKAFQGSEESSANWKLPEYQWNNL